MSLVSGPWLNENLRSLADLYAALLIGGKYFCHNIAEAGLVSGQTS